jgi:hypothetical protein
MLKRPICDSAVGGCDRPVGKAFYAIDAFPDDGQLWRDDRLEPRAIDNNKAPLPPTNDCARGESTDVSPTQEARLWYHGTSSQSDKRWLASFCEAKSRSVLPSCRADEEAVEALAEVSLCSHVIEWRRLHA